MFSGSAEPTGCPKTDFQTLRVEPATVGKAADDLGSLKGIKMPRYYFDTRDDDKFVCDDEGLELPNVQAATKVAARSLAELALEVLPSASARCLGVDVRDDEGDVLTTELTYKAILRRGKVKGASDEI